MLQTREHYDLIEQFEKDCRDIVRVVNFAKEPKELWPKGYVYQDGEVNTAFLAYRKGYALGQCKARLSD